MALVRSLLERFLINRRSIQQEDDIMRLYCLLHYYEACGGDRVKVAKPKNASFYKQYRVVHTSVTKQVRNDTNEMCDAFMYRVQRVCELLFFSL